jgi:hypothetical protein
VVVFAYLRRLDCPEHGVLVEAVPSARYRSGFTRDFEDVAAFLATKTDKSTIARFLRIDWDTVGRFCERGRATSFDIRKPDDLKLKGLLPRRMTHRWHSTTFRP